MSRGDISAHTASLTASHSFDLITSVTGDLRGAVREEAQLGPLATETPHWRHLVLSHRDGETFCRDPRLHGIGLLFFDMMGHTSRARTGRGS
jgi:hypothetical protein